jgi:hypothetical protein
VVTLAAEDKDFVLEVVLVVRRAAAGSDLEMAHVEIAGAFGRADQHPHLGTSHRTPSYLDDATHAMRDRICDSMDRISRGRTRPRMILEF